jgi:LmbE family N-acetylglucosaminyl deacetylase
MNSFFSGKKILIISPHPDDETLGCGGTVLKSINEGAKVYVLLVSVGTVAQYTRDGKVTILEEERLNEFYSVMERLNVTAYKVLYLNKDNIHSKMDIIPRVQLVDELEFGEQISINEIRPDIVMIPSPAYHQDHEAVFRASFTACRPSVSSIRWSPPQVWGYDNPAIFWSMEREKFHPNLYVDISRYLKHKIRVVSLYKSQMRPDPDHRSINNIELLAKSRGREISVEAAEAFVCYRMML